MFVIKAVHEARLFVPMTFALETVQPLSDSPQERQTIKQIFVLSIVSNRQQWAFFLKSLVFLLINNNLTCGSSILEFQRSLKRFAKKDTSVRLNSNSSQNHILWTIFHPHSFYISIFLLHVNSCLICIYFTHFKALKEKHLRQNWYLKNSIKSKSKLWAIKHSFGPGCLNCHILLFVYLIPHKTNSRLCFLRWMLYTV